MHSLIDFFKQNNIEFSQNISLKNISTFKIGGNAKIVCYPDCAQQVSKIVRYCKQNMIKYLTFGKCSNVVFSDNGIDDLIIKTDNMQQISLTDGVFSFGAGVMLAKASKYTITNGYKGFEFAFGIPGSVGGAVYMNAGAYEHEMSECVVKTEFVDADGNINYLPANSHDFSYRHSYFTNNDAIVTSTFIKLEKGNTAESEALVDKFQTARKQKQPLELPSAGSSFKRPVGHYAGKLIQDAGLMGYSVGGAMVSTKHAGFIVNYNNASSDDVKNLVAHIKKSVFDKFGVNLECEMKFID